MKKNNSILVIAAHPDDEVLGCGGTIAKYTKDKIEVNILFISDGESSRKLSKKKKSFKINKRKKNAIAAAKILGANKPFFLDLPDNELDGYPILKIIKKIERHIFLLNPSIIFTHFQNDLNIDHQIVSNAVVTACRPQGKNSVKSIFFFEVPSSTEWKIGLKSKLFNPNWFENISATKNKKFRALEVYKKELRKWPHPRSVKGVKSLVSWRGATAGVDAAEAFMLGRKIN
jgi:N-acetylglucosamine malate deacetylase 1